MAKIQEQMLSEGYTMYLDGWSTYFYNTNFYQAAKEMDEAGDMKFVLGMSYEIESWMDTDEALAKAIDAKQYASEHVKPNWVKLFIDGTVETGTGYVDPLYPDGHQGGGNWPEELLTREQALTALTINCAKQMFVENERGSISEGKYADFILVDKDVLSCPETEIHTARTAATYFEGEKVFSLS